MLIYQIDPNLVEIGDKVSFRGTVYQIGRLEREGQIEPILVVPTENGRYALNRTHHLFWTYSEDLVAAAIALKWDTILVTY